MKSSTEAKRVELLQELTNEGRNSSTWTIFFHQAVADKLGLNTTDHKCLNFILENSSVTAGQLAETTGLTTGAITGVLDRLEKAGYIERKRDTEDRRKVIIQPIPEKLPEVGRLFNSLANSVKELHEAYSYEELLFIRDYMRKCADVMRLEAQKLRESN